MVTCEVGSQYDRIHIGDLVEWFARLRDFVFIDISGQHDSFLRIEDGCFIGSRCIVVEGVIVEKEAVLGANVVLTQSTKIIDVSGPEPVELKGRVPARSVVIPGSYTKKFPAGEFGVGCALIIGQRKPSTDLKTSLNDALRDFNVSV